MARRRRWLVWLRRLFLGLLVAAVSVFVFIIVWFTSAGVWLYGDMAAYSSRRHGELLQATLERTVANGDTHVTHYYRLDSSSGLTVRLALRRPVRVFEEPLPLVVLLDGFKHGRTAIDRLGNTGNTIVAVASYPYEGERQLAGLAWMKVSRRLRRTMHDTPAALMLVLDFMLEQPGVDRNQVELMGVSLGSPLVCLTGALDTRVTRVWSVHGGGGYPLVVERLLARQIPLAPIRKPLGALIVLLCNRLDPAKYVDRISPRKLVLINGSDDGVFPRSSAELLYASAGEPKEQIWMDAEHVNPRRPELIRELVARVLARVEDDDGP